MNLIVDIGNSYAKVAVFDKNGQNPDLFMSVKQLTPAFLAPFFHDFAIDFCLISAVGAYDKAVDDFIAQRCQLVDFQQCTKLPIQICYATPRTLGRDRIANAVAAHALAPNKNVLSIQAGSCLVCDFVTKNGDYLGGSIAPGIDMKIKALHQFTAQLPQVEKGSPDHFIGKTTEQSILSGVINGTKHEIEGFIAQYQQEFGDVHVFLTGGNADLLKNSIKNAIFANSNLVLIGLNKILQINVENS